LPIFERHRNYDSSSDLRGFPNTWKEGWLNRLLRFSGRNIIRQFSWLHAVYCCCMQRWWTLRVCAASCELIAIASFSYSTVRCTITLCSERCMCSCC